VIPKNISKDDVVRQLSDFWKNLTEDQQIFLYDQLDISLYKKNETIYAENEEPRKIFCLVNGEIKIYKKGMTERIQIMRIVRPTQFFGYRAYFAKENYVTNACAFLPSVVASIPMHCIEKIVMENNQAGMFFIRQLATDLGISDRRSIILTQSHIRGRLAETLLFLKEQYGVDASSQAININLSREDLAGLSNMTTANAIRTLSNFASEKLISLDGRKIQLLDEQRLSHIAKIG
jgi:CRP-like cAMP-binding protein